MTKLLTIVYYLFIFISLIYSQQMQWILLSDGLSGDTPTPRRDAALGYDSVYLILYGGRDQSGMPRQDSYAFNTFTGGWMPYNPPNSPPARYGMASSSTIGSGLYIFGGFGMQGSSQFYNPYTSFRSSKMTNKEEKTKKINKRNSEKKNDDIKNKQFYNPNIPIRYDDDNTDENFYPLADSWFFSYLTKSWQPMQTFQYARGFSSAAASPYSTGIPRIIYSMGKSRNRMYSIVESIGQVTSGYNQLGGGQAAIIMSDLPSYNPQYPHARYSHSTTLLTDNHLLLYGGCLSDYGKGGPCPSTDTWLLYIDRNDWERLWECPTTKMGAAMVTLPSYSMCSSIDFGMYGNMNFANEMPVAILWGGRERNPSSIRTYPSPLDEVAVFSLSEKRWYLKKAYPSPAGGMNFPIEREGAAYVAGCYQGAPGMFVYGGRSVDNNRFLSDLWFLRASSQDALNAPGSRGCIYPFSYYHLHGIFQFFTYGVFFPIGYLVGRHVEKISLRRSLHMSLQIFGVALAICGFSFGVHAVRAPARLHFKHAHAIIGIITFILTIIQFIIGLIGAILLSKGQSNHDNSKDAAYKFETNQNKNDRWGGTVIWRITHRILGLLVLALGLVNICLGVFLAILPLPVWIIWYIYFGFLVLLIIGLEIVVLIRRGFTGQRKSTKISERQGESGRSSLNNFDESNIKPAPRHFTSLKHHQHDETAPLVINQRQPRSIDVTSSTILPEYRRPNEKQYPITAPKSETTPFEYYVGYSPERENIIPRSTIQQPNQHNLTRVRLQ